MNHGSKIIKQLMGMIKYIHVPPPLQNPAAKQGLYGRYFLINSHHLAHQLLEGCSGVQPRLSLALVGPLSMVCTSARRK